jgi:hypothetical protein
MKALRSLSLFDLLLCLNKGRNQRTENAASWSTIQNLEGDVVSVLCVEFQTLKIEIQVYMPFLMFTMLSGKGEALQYAKTRNDTRKKQATSNKPVMKRKTGKKNQA